MSIAPEASRYRYMDAVRDAIADEMRADPCVVLLGIDVGAGGGIFAVTRGLYEEFGPERVRDTPISESGVLGAAVGAAATGLKPIVELMFMDFLGVCFDPLLNQASKLRYMTGGGLSFPLVVRTQTGAGRSSGAQHSQSLEAIVAHVPGLKVVLPSTVADAYSLMRSAIRDPDPVVYVENRTLYSRRDVRPVLDAGAGAARLRARRASRRRRHGRRVVEDGRGLARGCRDAGRERRRSRGDRPARARPVGSRHAARVGAPHRPDGGRP